MADEKKKDDTFAMTTPAGLPAYPQVVYKDSGEKWPDGSTKMVVLGTANNPDEHKELLGQGKKDKGGFGA